MVTIAGRRTSKIKSYDDHTAMCENCHSANVRFTVYREYFHLYFVPLFPSDIKDVKGTCLNCGARNGNRIKEEYLLKTRTPIYFYSGTLLFASFIFLIIVFNLTPKPKESPLINDPQLGDVYLIKNEKSEKPEYYWGRVKEIKGEYVYLRKSAKTYEQIPSKMDPSDYFDYYNRTRFKKRDLIRMYEQGYIISVKRPNDR